MKLIPIRSAKLLTFVLTSLTTYSALAGSDCCDQCGQHAPCCRVGRQVPDEREIPVTCFKSECEDFCLPGPCKMGCKHCETACQDGCAAKGKKFAWTDIVTCCCDPTHTK